MCPTKVVTSLALIFVPSLPLFLQENVEIDLHDNSNNTALALAVGVSDEIADLLVKHGASFGILDKDSIAC